MKSSSFGPSGMCGTSLSPHERRAYHESFEALGPGAQAIIGLLGGKVDFVRFQPGPDIGGTPGDFKVGDPVWLSLDCPVVNALTGERTVYAEAVVLSIVPGWTARASSEAGAHEDASPSSSAQRDSAISKLEQQLNVMTVRHSRLAGAVPASRLRHRLRGEIAPGRKAFGPG